MDGHAYVIFFLFILWFVNISQLRFVFLLFKIQVRALRIAEQSAALRLDKRRKQMLFLLAFDSLNNKRIAVCSVNVNGFWSVLIRINYSAHCKIIDECGVRVEQVYARLTIVAHARRRHTHTTKCFKTPEQRENKTAKSARTKIKTTFTVG